MFTGGGVLTGAIKLGSLTETVLMSVATMNVPDNFRVKGYPRLN